MYGGVHTSIHVPMSVLSCQNWSYLHVELVTRTTYGCHNWSPLHYLVRGGGGGGRTRARAILISAFMEGEHQWHDSSTGCVQTLKQHTHSPGA